MLSLNPFEVREVLQVREWPLTMRTFCLNPFEVREVLQAPCQSSGRVSDVSIPLKSGRCCKWLDGYLHWRVKSQSL